jgi:hypothetical protein
MFKLVLGQLLSVGDYVIEIVRALGVGGDATDMSLHEESAGGWR